MVLDRIRELLGDRRGEIAAELAAELGIVRHIRLQKLVVERELGIASRAPPARGA
jgi:hypothetical protein